MSSRPRQPRPCRRSLVLMVGAFIVLSAAGLVASGEHSQRVDKIRALIDRGELDRASELMSELATVSHRSPDELIQRARLESKGTSVEEYLKAALAGATSPRRRESVLLDLARYYQASEDLARLESTIRDYFAEFKRGQFREEMARLQILLAERKSNINIARRLNLQLSKSSASSDTREWSRLNLARYGLGGGANSGRGKRSARRAALDLSSSHGSPSAPLALYLLATNDVATQNFDQAALNFNILREAYPHAIGGYDLIELISQFDPDRPVSSGEAERLLGSFYSVQVGVFSEKRNAKRQKARFEAYGEAVDMPRKTISGKKYYAVYVGRFDTPEQAAAFKQSLERSEKELFTIALRQK